MNLIINLMREYKKSLEFIILGVTIITIKWKIICNSNSIYRKI